MRIHAIRRHQLAFVAAATIVLAGTASLASANEYGVATEFSANFGAQTVRVDGSVTCAGGGAGFVFNDLWQGIQDDSGWLEVGTSWCDAGDPAAKWVWARYTQSAGYYEAVIQRNVSTGPNAHTFKIWNYAGPSWRIYIDGAIKVTFIGLGSGTAANSADVGLEVTPSRMGSIGNSTTHSSLTAWSAQGGSAPWSGQDFCHDTDPDIYPRWVLPTQWRHTLNINLPVSAC